MASVLKATEGLSHELWFTDDGILRITVFPPRILAWYVIFVSLIAFFGSGWFVYLANPGSIQESLALFFSYLGSVFAVSLAVLFLLIRWRDGVLSSVPIQRLAETSTRIPWEKVAAIELRGRKALVRSDIGTYHMRIRSDVSSFEQFLKSKVDSRVFQIDRQPPTERLHLA